jgi:short-subunit dehydrogenase
VLLCCCCAVNISSVAAYMSHPQAHSYCASKFAIRAYSDSLRAELVPFGVNVVHVAPGEWFGRQVMQAALATTQHNTTPHNW